MAGWEDALAWLRESTSEPSELGSSALDQAVAASVSDCRGGKAVSLSATLSASVSDC